MSVGLGSRDLGLRTRTGLRCSAPSHQFPALRLYAPAPEGDNIILHIHRGAVLATNYGLNPLSLYTTPNLFGVSNLRDTLNRQKGIDISIGFAAAASFTAWGAVNNGVTSTEFNGTLLCDQGQRGRLNFFTGNPATVNITGLTPNGDYKIGAVGTRAGGGATRPATLTNGVSAIEWDAVAVMPSAPEITVQADASGKVALTLDTASSTYGYLSGLLIAPIAS